jgi:hypothetical protein
MLVAGAGRALDIHPEMREITVAEEVSSYSWMLLKCTCLQSTESAGKPNHHDSEFFHTTFVGLQGV